MTHDCTPGRLAELCRVALPEEALSADDLETCCYGEGTEVIADEHGAIVWLHRDFGDIALAWILLIAVEPDRRRKGIGRALVDEVLARADRASVVEVHTGNCAPRYVWPGVDLSRTGALAFFQSLDFEAYDHGLNMMLTTDFRAEPPAGTVVERETGSGAVELARRAFPNWGDEIMRGVERGTTFAARDSTGETIAFGAHSVNRRTWIGPMATDPSRRAAGTGHAVLAALAQDIGSRFHVPAAEIAWVAPVAFYAKAGAVAHRAFRMHRRRLA